MLHGYIRMLQLYVSCCKRIFQVFQVFQTYILSVHLNVAKLDLDVVYMHVASVYMFQVFRVFHTRMLQVFYGVPSVASNVWDTLHPLFFLVDPSSSLRSSLLCTQ
jgi:hypothetical protein